MAGRREENRKAVLADIKAVSMAIIADTGDISDVSINGVARKIGLTPPALYSYFKNRDALIATLVMDCYQGFSNSLHAAERSTAKDAPGDRIYAVLAAWRLWALENPVIYKLLTSRADMDRIRAASPEVTGSFRDLNRFFSALLAGLVSDHDLVMPPIGADTAASYLESRELLETQTGVAGSVDLLHYSLQTFALVHGLISFELARRMYDFVGDPGLLFHSQMTEQIRKIIPEYSRR